MVNAATQRPRARWWGAAVTPILGVATLSVIQIVTAAAPATRPAAAPATRPATAPVTPAVTRPAPPAPPRPAAARPPDPTKVEAILAHLERDYAAKAEAKDWVTRGMGVLGLARLPRPLTARLLDRCERDEHPVVRLLAWQAVLARAADLTADEHARWVAATLALADKDAFRGRLRVPLLDVLATAAPTPRAKKVWARLFDQASAWEPQDVPVLDALGRCLTAWRSGPVAEGLVRALATRDQAVRAEYVLGAAGWRSRRAADLLDPSVLTEGVVRPGERSAGRRHPSYADLYKQAQREAAAWLVQNRQDWAEANRPDGEPWRRLSPAFVDPPVPLDQVDPRDPAWTRDLELGLADVARLEVAFVVDASGSMGPVLAWLQRDVARLMAALQVVYKDPPRVGVVFYRDRGGAFVTRALPLTPRLKELEQGLRTMSAAGGGDAAEAVLEGLRAGLGLAWTGGGRVGRQVVLVGDAPPKPGTEAACVEAARTARVGGAKVHAVQVTTPDERNDLSAFAAIAEAGGGAALPVEFGRIAEVYFVDENGQDYPLQLMARPEAQLTVARASADQAPGDAVLALLLADAINPQYRERVEPLARTLLAAASPAGEPERRLGFAANTAKVFPAGPKRKQ